MDEQPAIEWLKGGMCDTGACVEWGWDGFYWRVRSSYNRDNYIKFTAAEWHEFTRSIMFNNVKPSMQRSEV